MDWTRKLMQLAAVATIVIGAYLVYALLFSDVSRWSTIDANARKHIEGVVSSAILYFNLSFTLLLISSLVLFYDEEAMGYTLLVAAVALGYGVPLLVDMSMGTQLAEWARKPINTPALAIFNEVRMIGMVLAVPGGILALRDIVMRLYDGMHRKRDKFAEMEYGGAVKEEAPPNKPIVGMFAKCWQLPFCRDAIRKNCPIYLNKTRCWRQRVGCMCEENVIRHSMDAIIHREENLSLNLNKPDEDAGSKEPEIAGLVLEGGVIKHEKPAPSASEAKTQELPERKVVTPPPSKAKNLRIPHNPHLPMAAKVERCRNCVIYNEHQRMKYQFLAPFVVLGMPGLAIWQVDNVMKLLGNLLTGADKVMRNLSLDQNAKNIGVSQALNSSNQFAQYLIIGCMVVIVTTAALRLLEYVTFKLKW
jgi:hypothetical protein